MRRLAAVLLIACCAALPAVEEADVLAAARAVSVEYQARFQVLADGLQAKDEEQRLAAMRGLADLQDPQVVPLLMPFLEAGGRSQAEIVLACTLLGRMGAQTPVPALKALATDREPEIRKAATLALQQIGPVGAGDWMQHAEDVDPAMRLAATVNLGQLRHADAAKTLLAGLDHPKSLVRQAACIAIGRLGDPSLADKLRLQLTDADPRVRRYAAEAIAKLGYMPAMPDLLMALEADVAGPDILRAVLVLTGQDFGFDPHAPLVARQQAIDRGFAWLEAHAGKAK